VESPTRRAEDGRNRPRMFVAPLNAEKIYAAIQGALAESQSTIVPSGGIPSATLEVSLAPRVLR